MLSHERIWEVIDALAAHHGLSVSGLAKRAGLDPTTFNRSKRVGSDGRQRWPSTESIAKILQATGTDLAVFYSLLIGAEAKSASSAGVRSFRLPIVSGEDWGGGGFSEEGRLSDVGSYCSFPVETAGSAFVVPVTAPMLGGVYRRGDQLVVAPTASAKIGERLLIVLRSGAILAIEVVAKDGDDLLVSGAPATRIRVSDIAQQARILWVSQ